MNETHAISSFVATSKSSQSVKIVVFQQALTDENGHTIGFTKFLLTEDGFGVKRISRGQYEITLPTTKETLFVESTDKNAF